MSSDPTGAREPPVFVSPRKRSAKTSGIRLPAFDACGTRVFRPLRSLSSSADEMIINDSCSRFRCCRTCPRTARTLEREQHNFPFKPFGARTVQFIHVTQRITRMPRLSSPMKDVASCDKLRSAARQALPAEDFRMGQPRGSYFPRPGATPVVRGREEK